MHTVSNAIASFPAAAPVVKSYVVVRALGLPFFAASNAAEARSYLHWFPYDRVGVVNADP